MPNRFMRALHLSSYVLVVVMVQGVWSGSSPDVWAHDDSAQVEPMVTVTPREIKDVLYN